MNSKIRALRLNRLMACLAIVPCAGATAAVTHVVDQCSDSAAPFVCDGIDDGTLRKAFSCAGNNERSTCPRSTAARSRSALSSGHALSNVR